MEGQSISRYYSNGKLLLTAEYVVLDGAEALAIPTKKGQSLEVRKSEDYLKGLHWKSYTWSKECWLDVQFDMQLNFLEAEQSQIAQKLKRILEVAKSMNPYFLEEPFGIQVETHLDFPENWGLGSSSTLINNIAQWAHIDAFELQLKTFGGSGYDIACAQSSLPLIYHLNDGQPYNHQLKYFPAFNDKLFFVHLGKKQNSRSEIKRYRSLKENSKNPINQITNITNQLTNCNDLSSFEKLIFEHEKIMSELLKRVTVKEELFSDYTGAIKSLGAWGGDFILASGGDSEREYFQSKGYDTVISFSDMTLYQGD